MPLFIPFCRSKDTDLYHLPGLPVLDVGKLVMNVSGLKSKNGDSNSHTVKLTVFGSDCK
jgi:hypothetical protein